MKRIHVLGLALFVVFAFAAATAVSAFAATAEWLVNKEEVKENLPAETEWSLFLIKLVSSTNPAVLLEILCENILDGTVGAGGKGSVTAFLSLAKELIIELGESSELGQSCPVVQTHSSLEDCTEGSLAEVWPANLPWTTQLGELVESGIADTFTAARGGPGFEFNCLDSIGVLGEETCSGTTSALVSNEPGSTPPSVSEKFTEAASPAISCTGTGEGTGLMIGEGRGWAVGGTVAEPFELEHLETAVN